MKKNYSSSEKMNNPISDYYDELNQVKIGGNQSELQKARSVLFVAAVVTFIEGMIVSARIYESFELSTFIIALIESGIFLALALWTNKKPYTAIIIGLIAFILFIVFPILVNGIGAADKILFTGIFIKTFILIALIRLLSDAKKLQAEKNESPKIN